MSEVQPTPPKKKRTGLIILGVILAVFVVVIGGCAVLAAVVFNKAGSSVDEAVNAKTGLVDGSYTMNKDTSVVIGDRCSFSGDVFDMDGAPVSNDVVVVGSGELCGLGPSANLVTFSVTGGLADILSVE